MPPPSPAFSQQTFEQAVTWFVALQEISVDQAQQAKFQRWLQQHESHAAAYAEAEQLWSSFDNIKTADVPGLSTARAAAPRSIWHGLASVLLLAAASGWWLDDHAPTANYATNIGDRQTIVLADGSRIELNAATELSVRLSWFRREVRLDHGQAMFTVAHERLRPFDVHSGALKIHDIGTQFDVRKNQHGVEVVVLNGSVELSADRQQRAKRLTAGQRCRMDQFNHLQAIEAVDVDKAGTWLNGRLVFDHTPLSEVTAEIERHHPITFQFADASLAKETVSGNFSTADLKPFLRSLESILPIHAKRHAQTIVLSRR
jgi:transmembrane sensor